MNERNNENLLYAISTLGDVLESRDFSIRVKDSTIADRDAEIKDLKNRIASEHGREAEYESTIRIQKEYIANLEAKIYDLEERLAIVTESEADEECPKVLIEKKDIEGITPEEAAFIIKKKVLDAAEAVKGEAK